MRIFVASIVGLATMPGIAISQRVASEKDDQVANVLGVDVSSVQNLRAQRGMTDQALLNFPKARVPRALLRLNYPDIQRKRAAFRALQDKNEVGVIPERALETAIRQAEELRSKAKPSGKAAGLPAGQRVLPMGLLPPQAGLHSGGSGWQSLGPGNIGGRTRCIVVHPTDSNRIWAGSAGGGIWTTSNGGAKWQPVDDFMANLAVSCLAISPADPQLLFAGTGEGYFNLDALRGAGIFRSTDGGATWHQLQATANPHFRFVNRLTVSKNGKVVLAATLDGIFRNADSGNGAWTQQSLFSTADIDFNPNDNNKAVASTLTDGKVYYSEDSGATWHNAGHAGFWNGRVEVTYARKDPSIVYVSVNQNGGEVWRSTDGGKDFSLQNTGSLYLAEQGWYDNVIWAGDPTNADLVIVGGVDLHRSTDAGKTLTQISQWWSAPNSAHADHHVITASTGYNGTTNKTVYFGNDGGVYRANDVTTVGNTNGWTELNNNFAVTQFYGAAVHPGTGVVVAGAQDNGTLVLPSSATSEEWAVMYGGDGGFCASDAGDSKYFYGEYVYLNIHRSSDGGKSSDYISGQYWNGMKWVFKPGPYRIPDAADQLANFIAPFVLDPNNSNCILGGGLSLWRTNDAKSASTTTTGPKWEQIKTPIGSNPPEHCISAIVIAKGDSNVVWVGYNNGDVWRTANGKAASPSWTRMDNGMVALPDRFCQRLMIDPSDHNRVWATFGGYSKDNIWATTNNGATWKSISALLPEAPVRTIVEHPSNPNYLYIGTEVGIFASEDAGLSWSPSNEGPTNCSVDELFWRGKQLYAATHGRGIFFIDLTSP